MKEEKLNYPEIVEQSMRGVVREVLRRVEKIGNMGDHHFFISFATGHPKVKISQQLRTKYPREITIVLQHQYWDFKVEEAQFQVTLSFGGVPEKLTVPFDALTGFADPSVKFGLQFQPVNYNGEDENTEPANSESEAPSDEAPIAEDADKIISLDAFRKK